MTDLLTRSLDREERTSGRVLVTLLAGTATLTSMGISILAGWARGGSTMERTAWVFVGLVLLLSAHLIPALTKGLHIARRAPALIIWAGAMLATGYGHATFFVVAQHDAGAVRARLVPTQPTPVGQGPVGRSQGVIAADRATVDQQLAALEAQKCRDTCTYITYRRKTLQARRAALDIEMQDAKRRYALEDEADAARAKTEAQRETAMADPVSALLSGVFGVKVSAVNLWLSVFLGWLMESVACLAWSLALPLSAGKARRAAFGQHPTQSPGRMDMTEADSGRFVATEASLATPALVHAVAPIVEGADIVNVAKAANDDRATPVERVESPGAEDISDRTDVHTADDLADAPKSNEAPSSDSAVDVRAVPADVTRGISTVTASSVKPSDVDRLEVAIRAGEVETSVASIRDFLGCTETQAQELKWAYCRRPYHSVVAS